MLIGSDEVSLNGVEKPGEPCQPCLSSFMPNSTTMTSSSTMTSFENLDAMARQAPKESLPPKPRRYQVSLRIGSSSLFFIIPNLCILSKKFPFQISSVILMTMNKRLSFSFFNHQLFLLIV